jgi:hypothetical protein
MPEAGFTGPVSELNRTFAAYPGSVRTRFSNRKPQTHSYAAYSPVLHYNAYRGDIEAFIAYFNETMAKPFRWTFSGKPLAA